MTATERVLRLEEADGQWSELPLPLPLVATLQAAVGIVAAAPECAGRARALERLEGGGEDGARLAGEILAGALFAGA